jgi:hypothetical protein
MKMLLVFTVFLSMSLNVFASDSEAVCDNIGFNNTSITSNFANELQDVLDEPTKDITNKVSSYLASTAEENYSYSLEVVKEIEAARANYLCQKFNSTDASSYESSIGSNSLMITLELDNNRKYLGYYSTGVDYIYANKNGLIQSKHFKKLVCKN